MRRRLAEGLAVLLSVASLGAGAASGPSLEAAKVTKPQVTATSGHTSPKTKRAYQVGTASWYGDYFQGKQTASGEPFDKNDLTAAHPTLPLGTFVRVTNLKNGRAVIVRINDRGPVVDGRIIDLSYNAAQSLGFKERGLQTVRLDIYHPATIARLEPVAKLN
ncbi:MAG: septal ring lytic transglycosylase RlpA family protein [Terriglobales bacterium]|jgi:rare lipoprotein A